MASPLPDDGTGVALLAAIDDETPKGTTDETLARWCGNGSVGVDRSLVGHWRSGSRGVPVWAAIKMLRRLPAPARARVLGSVLDPLGLTVSVTHVEGSADTIGVAALRVGSAVGLLHASVAAATDRRGPGGARITQGEQEGLSEVIVEAQRALAQLASLVRAPGVRCA